MGEIFKELGKSILTLANMLSVLVFFRSYSEKHDSIDLIFGILVLIVFYGAALSLIGLSESKGEK